MPFPLAHPAAVFPLRRWCPRRLSLAALVIGSLVPDVGYLFPAAHAAAWSHSFWSGGLGFCLPVGFMMFWAFRCGLWLSLKMLPARSAKVVRLLACESAPPFLVVTASMLIGVWTHILLDSMTHTNGWVAEHFTLLQHVVLTVDGRQMKVCQVLYHVITFLGVAYLSFCFQHTLDQCPGIAPRLTMGSKCAFALLFSGLLLIACVYGRGLP